MSRRQSHYQGHSQAYSTLQPLSIYPTNDALTSPAMSHSYSNNSGSSDESSQASMFGHSYQTTSPLTYSPTDQQGYYYQQQQDYTQPSYSYSDHRQQQHQQSHARRRQETSPTPSDGKSGNETRYFCAFPKCPSTFGRSADLTRHQKSTHFESRTDCPRPRCERKGSRGFTRPDHLKEHLRSYHKMDLPKREGGSERR